MSQKIADLEIVIHDQAEDAATKVDNLADATKKLGDTSKGIKDVASGMSKVNEAASKSGADKLRAAISSVDETVKNLCNSLDEATKKIGGINSGGLSSASAEKMGDAVQETVRRVDKLSQGFMTTVRTARALSHTIMPNIVHQFGRMLKMRVMRTIVKQFLAGITEGLQNVYNWATMVGNGFKATMDGMASSALYLKNSIGAAFASLVSLVAPHINSLIDVIVEGINYVNMFFAVLGGQTTYTKAKKVAVEYGKAASGAIGGAASAAKELKETLSVLDFDELNQLADQPTPSTGGGGGGGGGTPGTDYSDMFETADITANKLTEIAGWLRDNFKDVLTYVAAIETGILAWKITDTLAKNLTALKDLSLSQKIGVALAVTGFTLELQGAIGLGRGDNTLANAIKTAIGSALGVLGTAMAFKFTPTGWAVGLTVALTVFVMGYIKGKIERFEKMLDENELHKQLQSELDAATQSYEYAVQLKANVDKIDWKLDDSVVKGQQAQNLLDQIKEFNGMVISPEVDTEKLDLLVEAFNSLNLIDVKLTWEDINGKIKINIEAVQKALDEYKAYAEGIAKQNAILALEQQKVLTGAELTAAEGRLQGQQNVYDTLYSEFTGNLAKLIKENPSALYAPFIQQAQAWTPGEAVPALVKASDPEMAVAMENINTALATLDTNRNEISVLEATLEAIDVKLGEIYGEVSGINELMRLQAFTLPVAPTVYEQATGTLDRPIVGSSRYDLQKQFEQVASGGGLNIFADPSKNISYMKTYGVAVDGVTNATEGASDASNNLGKTWNFTETAGGGVINTNDIMSESFTDLGKTMQVTTGDANSATVAMRQIGTGLNLGAIRKGFQVNLAPHHFTETAKGIKKTMETTLNSIGSGMQYGTIMTTINKGLSTAQASTPFTDIGVSIGSNMQSGSLSGYDESAIITSYKNGLTTEKKKITFNPIGTSIGGNIQTGAYNGFSSNVLLNDYLEGMTNKKKKTSFTGIGGTIGGDVQSGAYNGFSSYGLLKDMKTGMEKTFDLLDFTPIGETIAGDIKYGIKKKLNNTAIDVTTSVGGVQSTTKGTMWVNMTAANGALGLNAGTVFIAGEAGAEAVGTINGRTGVANRDQIASAIAMALQPMLSGGGTTTTNVNVNMDSASVARASLKGQRAMNKQYNIAVRS